MYNDVQGKLDAFEHADREKDLKLAAKSELLEQKDAEIERLRDEVRQLKAQIKMFGGGGAVVSQSGLVTSSNSGLNSVGNSMKDAPSNWQEQLSALNEQHSSELNTLRLQLEKKISVYRSAADRAAEEVSSLEYELSSERQRHLSTLQDTKMYQGRALSMENTMECRVQELLVELSEKTTAVEDLLESRRMESARANLAERAVLELKDKMAVEMVSKAQVAEMESLFLDTVQRLTNRVNEVEKRRNSTSSSSSSSSSAGMNGGGGAAVNDGYRPSALVADGDVSSSSSAIDGSSYYGNVRGTGGTGTGVGNGAGIGVGVGVGSGIRRSGSGNSAGLRGALAAPLPAIPRGSSGGGCEGGSGGGSGGIASRANGLTSSTIGGKGISSTGTGSNSSAAAVGRGGGGSLWGDR
jgi:hypothetical protein